ncbi:hypothetical protein H2200_006257 [Cladophialophora chaetospira]|uniref:Uncharacterized protein n=1 Tax=Cladophialophora chaetospira TaxID=386627 RepID=A0AA39CIC3_9EURO|nr:hypothetical protein H2200_006257 [Cladophialophora chaetospira]
MDGFCTQCNVLWNTILGRFCPGCGSELFVRKSISGPSHGAEVTPPPHASQSIEDGHLLQASPATAEFAARFQVIQISIPSRVLPPPGESGLENEKSGAPAVETTDPKVVHQSSTARSAANDIPHGGTTNTRNAPKRVTFQSAEKDGLQRKEDNPSQSVEVIDDGNIAQLDMLLATRNSGHITDTIAISTSSVETTNPSRESSPATGGSQIKLESTGKRRLSRQPTTSTADSDSIRNDEHLLPLSNTPIVVKLEADATLAQERPSLMTRDARSRSPPRVRFQDDTEGNRLYRERDRRPRRSLSPFPRKQPNQHATQHSDSVAWKNFIEKFHRDHGPDALPTLQSFWDEFYPADGDFDAARPASMLHIKDIAHRWILHVNQFDAFVRERNELLSDVARYLNTEVSKECYQAWETRKTDCEKISMRYMSDLLGFAHNLQWFLIRKPLLGAGAKEPSNAEFARYLFSLRHERGRIQIDQREYQTCLNQLNQYRDKYSDYWERAVQKLQEDMETYGREGRKVNKIRESFLCLRSLMLEPGRKAFLRSISPEDFPLPNIPKIKGRWHAWDEH